MLCLINTSDTLWIWVPRVFPCTRTSSIKHKLHKYRICSIRCHGYYLFDRAILCGFYSRAATNRERRLFSSVFSVKSFVIVRALRKASFIRLTKNCDAVTWFWSKHSSLINRRFATKQYLHGTSNPFPCFLPIISQDDHPPCLKNCWTSLDSVSSCTYCIYSCHLRHEVVHMRMYYLNISRG